MTNVTDFIEFLKERRGKDFTREDKDEVYMGCIVHLHKRIDEYEKYINKILKLYHDKAWECEDLKREMEKYDRNID